MSERKPFLLRLDPATMSALKAWAADELRSLNGQIEYLLRLALRDAGRLPSASRPTDTGPAKVDAVPATTQPRTSEEKTPPRRQDRRELAVGSRE